MTPDDDDKVKLYLLTPDGSWLGGYGTYDAAVVAAKSREAAQRLHPSSFEWTGPDVLGPRPLRVFAKFIGYAADDIKVGDIISTSYLAG